MSLEKQGIRKVGQKGGPENFCLDNPLNSLTLLRMRNSLLVTLAGRWTKFADGQPQRSLFQGPKYPISPALIGLCFVSAGLSYTIGAPLAGGLSESTVIGAKRNGVWYSEDRLQATIFGAAVFVPLSVFGCGWITEFINEQVLDAKGS